jgi:lipoprotein-anchoring transpeptidase ErfK/SrfK
MNFPLKTLLCLIASSTILLGGFPLSAARRLAPSRRAGGLAELPLQVLLDRAGFSPGQIDGAGGANTRKAEEAFRASHGLAPGAPRDQVLAALGGGKVDPIVSYTITDQDAAGPFAETIPQDMAEKSKLPGLYYTSVLEELAEKFHSSPALLKRLNPSAHFSPGERIRVPNVQGNEQSASRGAPKGQNDKPASSTGELKVVVSKNKSDVTVYDSSGKIVFYAPVTSGSEHDPLPIGNWQVTQIRRNPVFYYNPELFWDADPTDTKAKIAAGPNNPVGVVWIDINKPHYGIHGSPEPGRIGHSESHGCVRLTNWGADRLASLVAVGTPVVFKE